VPKRSSRKYRICTDSIAKTAGTPKRSTWSPAAKSRYDRCLKKVDEKQTNEVVQAAKLRWEKTLRRRKFQKQHGTGGTTELTGQTAANPTIGGKRMQVSHTVYDRIGGLIREFSLPVSVRATARAAKKYVQGDPTAPKKPAAGTRQTTGTTTTAAPPPAPKSPKPEAEKKNPEEEETPKKAGMVQRLIRGQNPYTQKHSAGTVYRG